ncbi:MAG: hypothetical protein QOE65_2043, partial [Solirubrobacteraceae bacterium]|nr:hypothetical protein [Solirubrobacteraceae bacterium]
MSRRALAPLVLALLVVPAAGPAAAKTPKVTPKTGTYKGSEQNTKKPAVLTVTKSHGALRVSANLTVHVECQDKNGVKSEKDIPLNVAGKLHTAGYYSPQFKQRVNGYAFSQKKRTTGYPTGPDSFQNVLIQFTSSTRGSVDAVYNDSLTGPDSPDVLSRCDSHSLFWKPAWQKPKRLAAAALPSVKPKTGK